MTRPGPRRAAPAIALALCLGGCIDYFPELPARPDGGAPDPEPEPAPCTPTDEQCNGVDDDCDGATDEQIVGCDAESCMICHNGARAADDYSGGGLANPHAFPPSDAIPCTGCHGGDGAGGDARGSHVPPPPEVGDRDHRAGDLAAHVERLTLTGLDRRAGEPYDVDGRRHTRLDYLQFVNPGDLRVVTAGRGCGQAGCHAEHHAEWVPRGLHATNAGIFSGARFAVGVDPRAGQPPLSATTAPRAIGGLTAQPEPAGFGGPLDGFAARDLEGDVDQSEVDRPNRVGAGTALADLIDAQVNARCGDCHLWSAGSNDRAGRYRASGCPACHMEYANNGRYRGNDVNIPRDEPADPDALQPGERPHVRDHQIRNVIKTLPNGTTIRGISDRACLACHRDSNQTVLQYWGIRPDPDGDLGATRQYPFSPARYRAIDPAPYGGTGPRIDLIDPATSATFDGRPADRYLEFEDYDGDGRDDTPPDVHAEAGMVCIDCHGSRDVHGGTADDPTSSEIVSRKEHATRITCESCHGTVDAFARTEPCETYTGEPAECAVDAGGNPLRHVTKDAAGHYWLRSRIEGDMYYVVQTRDVTVNTPRMHPTDDRPLYSPKASYAMGRADGNGQTGTGPRQDDGNLVAPGFTHMETLDCAACHASWTNNCIGCHIAGRIVGDDDPPAFSHMTGERTLLADASPNTIYQTPILTYIGVGPRGRITRFSPAEKAFWRFTDGPARTSPTFAFGDRRGEGNSPGRNGRNLFPALSADAMAPHSIRGATAPGQEGPLYCVGCHINADMTSDRALMAEYDLFAAAYERRDFAAIDFDVLRREIGQNPGNQRNSPFYVRMITGLGTGLFLFGDDGCPINPLDPRADRGWCAEAPAEAFAERVGQVAYDLDRMVEPGNIVNVSTGHCVAPEPARAGCGDNPPMTRPLPGRILDKLMGGDDIADALVLDAWLDADGTPRGLAEQFIGQ